MEEQKRRRPTNGCSRVTPLWGRPTLADITKRCLRHPRSFVFRDRRGSHADWHVNYFFRSRVVNFTWTGTGTFFPATNFTFSPPRVLNFTSTGCFTFLCASNSTFLPISALQQFLQCHPTQLRKDPGCKFRCRPRWQHYLCAPPCFSSCFVVLSHRVFSLEIRASTRSTKSPSGSAVLV